MLVTTHGHHFQWPTRGLYIPPREGLISGGRGGGGEGGGGEVSGGGRGGV